MFVHLRKSEKFMYPFENATMRINIEQRKYSLRQQYFTFLGSREMKSLWSMGLRNALTVPCWWCCIDFRSSSTNSI